MVGSQTVLENPGRLKSPEASVKSPSLSSGDDSDGHYLGIKSISESLSFAVFAFSLLVSPCNVFTSMTILWWNSQPCTKEIMNA
jgi:hypothetical protein